MSNKVNSYALFVDGDFASMFYYPADSDRNAERITAALQSDPTIVVDSESDIEGTYRYSVSVEEEYVGKLYLVSDSDKYPVAATNAALQSNPKVVFIDSESTVSSNTKWRLENGEAVLDQE